MKRLYITTTILLLTAAAAIMLDISAGSRKAASSIQNFPDRIGRWQKQEAVTFKKEVLDILGTKDVIGRVYQEPGGRTVELIMVYAVNNRSAFHPPEYCLTGSGRALIGKNVYSFNIGADREKKMAVNEMVYLTGMRNKLVVWNWYCAGREMTENFYSQQFRLIYNNIRFGSSPGAVVNLYCYVKNDNLEEARRLNRDLTESFLPILLSYLQ